MNNQKSIIGQNYRAKGLAAFDLEKMTRADLGKRSYKIIKDPYVSDYRNSDVVFNPFAPREAVFVNVLDESTGRTYKVVYEPGNLLKHANLDEPKNDQPGEPVDFATRAGQIAEELKVMFDPAGGGISDKCGVAFFAVSDDGNDKTSTCVGFLGGRGGRVSEAIASACSKNPQVFEIVKRASIEVMFHRIFDSKDEKK